jgi:tetratricopeptide (TPR) repeat protein
LSHRAFAGTAFRTLAAAALAAALFSAAGPGAVWAKGTATPEPTPSPAATPTPEPLTVAIPRLEAVVRANPSDYDAMTLLATDYLQAQRPDLTVQLTPKLIAGGRKTGQVYYIDGMANLQLGRTREATASLEQAANYEPTNSQILLSLTELYLRSNRTADAERVAKRATTFNQNDSRTVSTYGLVLAQEGKYDEARAQFEAAAKLDPKSALPLSLIGQTYKEQKAYAYAITAFDRAIAVDPKFIDAYQGKASAYLAQNDTKNAVATYESLYPYAPDDNAKIEVLGAEARIYATAKDPASADAVLRRGIAAFPNNPLAHLEYGDFLVSQNKVKEATAEWNAALGPNGDNRDALLRLGTLELTQGYKTQAIASFKKITETHPGDAEALLRLGQAYVANAQYSDARDAYRRSFEASQSVSSLAGIAVCDCAMRNFHEGTQILDTIVAKAPEFPQQNPQMYLMMGKCYTDAGQKDKAKVQYTKLLAFTKPGSSDQAQLKKLIADLDKAPAAKPAASPKN